MMHLAVWLLLQEINATQFKKTPNLPILLRQKIKPVQDGKYDFIENGLERTPQIAEQEPKPWLGRYRMF